METVSIFVSYSRIDSKILEPVQGENTAFLRRLLPLEKEADAKFYWDSRFVLAGDLFDEVIEAQIKACHILLTLISDDFLHSLWCEKEVEIVLGRRRAGEKVYIVPFYLHHCEWERSEWLANTHALPAPDLPYWGIKSAEKRNEALLDLRKHLRRRINMIRGGM